MLLAWCEVVHGVVVFDPPNDKAKLYWAVGCLPGVNMGDLLGGVLIIACYDADVCLDDGND